MHLRKEDLLPDDISAKNREQTQAERKQEQEDTCYLPKSEALLICEIVYHNNYSSQLYTYPDH